MAREYLPNGLSEEFVRRYAKPNPLLSLSREERELAAHALLDAAQRLGRRADYPAWLPAALRRYWGLDPHHRARLLERASGLARVSAALLRGDE